jgi:hypothetical protein
MRDVEQSEIPLAGHHQTEKPATNYTNLHEFALIQKKAPSQMPFLLLPFYFLLNYFLL